MSTRRQYGRELWERMCEFVKQPDGLPEYECGQWTIDKLYFLGCYLAITTHGMRDNTKFKSLNYIDLFSGAGVCSVARDGGRRARYPGSSLLAAGCEKQFHNLYLVDDDSERLDALIQRIRRLNCQSRIHSWTGDANQVIGEVSKAIPPNSLNVAFVDPYSLDIRYSTIKKLAEQRPLDLLILFADGMDIVRNVEAYYLPQTESKLDIFLGEDSNWREAWAKLHIRDGGRVRQFFADIYLQQLSKIGYIHTRTRVIESDTGPLYRLVYASKDKLGAKYWDIAVSDDFDGQKTLWTL